MKDGLGKFLSGTRYDDSDVFAEELKHVTPM